MACNQMTDCNPVFKEKGSVRFSALYLKKKRNLLVFTSANLIVMTSSFAVTTADAFDKRQQQQDSTSSTSTLATTISANGNFDLTLAPVTRTASAAAKPCQGDSFEFYLITGSFPDGQAPPSPDYMPGPEHPPSSDYIPSPEYPKYVASLDDEVPIEDQPLPADASPTALSPGYVVDSDSEEDPAEYPANGGDDDDDEEASEEDNEEEEHLAPANSTTLPVIDPAPSAEDTKALETDESASTPP
ncbi:hypothetical protein Tco_1028937 [Tanacetum coccineum]|uniref:Uncharacterized protein n=1 Tax=Tanacetum coccineum TaxID=301880 RepID=A0ABQ5G287_9ASTR